MKHSLFGLTATAAVAMALLTGCPAEEKKETGTSSTTTTTTTTTTASSDVASPEAGTMASPTAAESMAATTAPTAAASAMSAASPAATATAGKTTMAAAGGVDAKTIFAQKCAGCHGANGGGGMGPNLANVEAKGDDFIRNRIKKGSPTKGMPAFGEMLKTNEIDALIAYVKSL